MKRKELKDVLPELGQVIAHDFAHFESIWFDVLVGYSKVFDGLLDILMLPSKAEDEAVKVIEEFIASRQKPYGQWKSPDWLAYMLGQIVEKTKKRQRRKRQKALADDELPF